MMEFVARVNILGSSLAAAAYLILNAEIGGPHMMPIDCVQAFGITLIYSKMLVIVPCILILEGDKFSVSSSLSLTHAVMSIVSSPYQLAHISLPPLTL
jgi:hypothetical protein